MDVQTIVESAPLIAYVGIVALVALDAVAPLIPAEIAVLTASALSLDGHLEWWAIALAAAAGGIVGDQLTYRIGQRVLRRQISALRRRLSRNRKDSGKTTAEPSVGFVVVGRFVPGGRSAAGAVAGHLRIRWRRFALASMLGSIAWATSTVLIGRGASAVVDGPMWQQILASVLVGLALTALLVGVRRVIRVRRRLSPSTVTAPSSLALQTSSARPSSVAMRRPYVARELSSAFRP